jgi:hypothetical protein
MNAPSTDLINTDYVVGIPLSWRSGLFSTRVRLYHQSTHLGDEFVLHNPGVNRVNYSYEEAEAILSLNAPGGWGRLCMPAADTCCIVSRPTWTGSKYRRGSNCEDRRGAAVRLNDS